MTGWATCKNEFATLGFPIRPKIAPFSNRTQRIQNLQAERRRGVILGQNIQEKSGHSIYLFGENRKDLILL